MDDAMAPETPGSDDGEAAVLTLAMFAARMGAAFAFASAGIQVELTLVEALALPHAARAGGGFRLEFEGPAAPSLPQGTYAVRWDDAVHEIFIVPVARGQDGLLRYEAIFF